MRRESDAQGAVVTDADGKKRRILAWPREFLLNPVPGVIYDGLERRHGWTVKPFNYRRALLGQYEILHISFPSEAFRNPSKLVTLIRMAITMLLISAAKWRGRKLVWTVHNLADHERHHGALENRFMHWFTRRLDLTIHMSQAGRQAALSRYPELADKPDAVIPHPHYGSIAGKAKARADALAELGLPADCRLVLAFGVVRRYKNLLALIRAFAELPDRDVHLMIAGMVLDPKLARTLRETATDQRITLTLKPVAVDKIGTYFGAATLVVAPYIDILNSGTAFLSLTLGRPILVPNRGTMTELRDKVGREWIHLLDPPLTGTTIATALNEAERLRNQSPDLSSFEPDEIVAAHTRLLGGLLRTGV